MRLDAFTAPEFAAVIRNACATGLPCEIDMSAVTFIGSPGLTALIAARHQHTVVVRRGNPLVDRILEITGLTIFYGDDETT